MKFTPIQTKAPDALPLSLEEAKEHCRISGPDHDATIQALIGAAVSHMDGYNGVLGKCLMLQEWQQEFDRWQDFPLCLGPVRDLVSIDYLDGSGQAQSVDLSAVRIERRVLGTMAALKGGYSWPGDADFDEGLITVKWSAGYASAADVPPAIKHALKLLIGHWFENREAVIVGTTNASLQMAVDNLIAPYRRVAP